MSVCPHTVGPLHRADYVALSLELIDIPCRSTSKVARTISPMSIYTKYYYSYRPFPPYFHSLFPSPRRHSSKANSIIDQRCPGEH